ncbi:inner membrane-spanning protein YciB [Rhodococcus koreensis]
MWRAAYNIAVVFAFFTVYKTTDIFAATIVVMSAVGLEVAWTLARRRRVDRLQWAGLGLVLLLGGSTLLFRNDIFIKLRPTGVYWLIAAAFMSLIAACGRYPVQLILGRWVHAPEHLWARVSRTWIVALFAIGSANLAVAYSLPTDTWVNWRVFVAPGLLLVLALGQCVRYRRYLSEAVATHRAKATGQSHEGPAMSDVH